MKKFTAHRLCFVIGVETPVELNEHQGSAIRGALFDAPVARMCMNREAEECARCPLVAACPVAFLVNTLRPDSGRGRDVPRPFTVQPPLPGSGHPMEWEGRLAFSYQPGEPLVFGLILNAKVAAVPVPPPGATGTLRFRKPVRLIEKRALVKPNRFGSRPFFQWLTERLEGLSRHFSDTLLVFEDPRGMIAATEGSRWWRTACAGRSSGVTPPAPGGNPSLGPVGLPLPAGRRLGPPSAPG